MIHSLCRPYAADATTTHHRVAPAVPATSHYHNTSTHHNPAKVYVYIYKLLTVPSVHIDYLESQIYGTFITRRTSKIKRLQVCIHFTI